MLSGDKRIRFSLKYVWKKANSVKYWEKRKNREEIEKKISSFSGDLRIVHMRGDRVCHEATKSYTLDKI